MTSEPKTVGPQTRRGIATIANDKVIAWLLPFLESYARTNRDTPLTIIPYDDNIAETRRAAAAYGVEVSDIDNKELDKLSKRLYPFNPGHRHRLRKFLSLALPLDEVVYVDVDIILFQDFRQLFGIVAPGKDEFIVACRCHDYVYNSLSANYPDLKNAFLFNDGFFVTSKNLLSLEDIYETIAKDEQVFHKVRQRGGLFAQPLTNFVVHRRGIKIGTLHEAVPGASAESFYKAEKVQFTDDGPRDEFGNKIYFAHWAGVVGMPKGNVFDPRWHELYRQATGRLQAA